MENPTQTPQKEITRTLPASEWEFLQTSLGVYYSCLHLDLTQSQLDELSRVSVKIGGESF